MIPPTVSPTDGDSGPGGGVTEFADPGALVSGADVIVGRGSVKVKNVFAKRHSDDTGGGLLGLCSVASGLIFTRVIWMIVRLSLAFTRSIATMEMLTIVFGAKLYVSGRVKLRQRPSVKPVEVIRMLDHEYGLA